MGGADALSGARGGFQASGSDTERAEAGAAAGARSARSTAPRSTLDTPPHRCHGVTAWVEREKATRDELHARLHSAQTRWARDYSDAEIGAMQIAHAKATGKYHDFTLGIFYPPSTFTAALWRPSDPPPL